MKCNNCGKDIPNESKFCMFCGTIIETPKDIECPKCKNKNPLDAAFCTECGHSLTNTKHNSARDLASAQSKENTNNTLDPSNYNFVLFRGIQIYGTEAMVEEKLCSLGYKKKGELFIGSYGGYDCTIETMGGPTSVCGLVIRIPHYDYEVRENFMQAIQTKYQGSWSQIKRNTWAFDAPFGKILIGGGENHCLRLRLQGFYSEYERFQSEYERFQKDRALANIIEKI